MKARFVVARRLEGPKRTGRGTTLEVEYVGPDRRKAHAVAEEVLRGGKNPVMVWRVTRETVLTAEDLVAGLPKDALT